MITWHTSPAQGLVDVAYCRIGSTVLRRRTSATEATEWARATSHWNDPAAWPKFIDEDEWRTIDRDEAGRLLGVVTAETITDDQIAELMGAVKGRRDAASLRLRGFCRQAFIGEVDAREACALAYNTRLGWLP